MNTESTPIQRLVSVCNNRLFIKREDLIPFSFGGNKARKAELFFGEIDAGNFDCVVTYGSSSSNHCRVVSNMAAARGIKCCIVSPEEASHPTYNSRLMTLFGAEITMVPVNDVHDTIENKLSALRDKGMHPYFIPGGGHGNIGTQAYVNCYNEICDYEHRTGVFFDYIFHASGTGTTQAGLVCGQLMHRDDRTIVGVSIARKNPRGRRVVLDSVAEYLAAHNLCIPKDRIELCTVFEDSYTGQGYGDPTSDDVIRTVLIKYGIALDPTYTGKAFKGMIDYIAKNGISEKNILFIHTGGTPLFFDFLGGLGRKQ